MLGGSCLSQFQSVFVFPAGTRASSVSQQVQSVSARVSEDQVTAQSSRYKLSVG